MFAGEPLELIAGQLLVAEPHYPYHASGITRVSRAIQAILPAGWLVRTQLPVSLDDDSEPEPDLVVVPDRADEYSAFHPERPVLVVEVAESSLAFDRCEKASLYARAGIADYWIVNLVDRALEVHREPVPDPSAVYRWRYRSVTTLAPPAVVAPLAFPASQIAVANLLPRRPPVAP